LARNVWLMQTINEPGLQAVPLRQRECAIMNETN